MSTLALQIPTVEIHSGSQLSPEPRQLKDWLSHLPLGDCEQAAEQLLVVLHSYNRCNLSPLLRYQEMEVFGAVAGWLVKDLSSKYSDSPIPLGEKNRYRFILVDRLLAEWTSGYKLVLKDIYDTDSEFPLGIVLASINRAIALLSKQLLSRYAVYIRQPDGVWSDLNQLYRCAEQLAGQGQVTTDEKYVVQINVIFQAYRQIVLLSIANPYHLMHQEAHIVYKFLKKWASDCRIISLTGYVVSLGDLVIDLNSDNAPYFLRDLNFKEPEQVRTLNMGALVERFGATLKAMKLKQSEIEGTKFSFNERKHRDMLLRLQKVWSGRLERNASREEVSQKICLVSGLSAVHYFTDEEQDFSPEYDEIKYFRPEELESKLSLMPTEYEPWKQEELENQVSLGMDNARISLFTDKNDVWSKVTETEEHLKLMRENHLSNFNSHHWQLVNLSADGIGLKRELNSAAHVRVGHLIAFKHTEPGSIGKIGEVKWIVESSEIDFNIGVSVLHGKPLAVAVRCVDGAGCGGEYFRCIVMNQHLARISHPPSTVDADPSDLTGRSPSSRLDALVTKGGKKCGLNTRLKPVLFAPASIFDTGSMLILNRRDDMNYVQLTNLISTSAGFSKFEFSQTPISKQDLSAISTNIKQI